MRIYKIKTLIFTILFAVAFISSGIIASAQEIKVNINVNMEQINFDNRVGLNNFKTDVERYINTQRFLDEDWEGDPIPVEMNIILSAAGKNRYNAKVLMASRRLLDGPADEVSYSTTIQFYEKEWQFEYNNGANLSLNLMRYDELSTMLNYYMLMIIGFDMDTYQAGGGTRAFEKARNLAVTASNADAVGFETRKDAAIFNKYNLVNEILDMRMAEVRRLIFAYYVNGLDKIAFHREEALLELSKILSDIANYRRNKLMLQNHLLTIFFETKANEIATLFNGHKDKALFDNLKYLDPTNTPIYTQSEAGTFLKK